MVNPVSGRRVPWLAVWLVLCLFTVESAFAADVTATLDRDRVVQGETVTLVLQTDDPQQSLETDLDRLNADFHVIDQRSETQMSIANGRQTAVVRLLVTLEPRSAGHLTIPSFQFRGGASTSALSLDVEPAPKLAPGEAPPVFIEVEVDPREGPYYVHAQLSLKVRIFYQQNLTEAAINPPSPDQASVSLLDEVPYQADRNGVRYRVLERRYAVFPERSGELTIPPLELTGRLIERPADRLWQPSVRGRRIRVESDPIILDISPRPPAFTGATWLPARKVELAQQITDGDTVKVGEPVTRTVILDAVGLEEHMLEEPPWPPMEHARIYPDQPQGISRDDGQWVLGHREYRYAVVPEQAGELVLPEIRLPWWDTINNEQKVAVLPEHRVTVLPSTPATGGNAAGPAAAGAPGPARTVSGAGNVRPWQWLSLILGLGWAATAALLIRRRRGAAPDSPGQERAGDDEKALLRTLQRACEGGDAAGAHAALGRWVRGFGPRSAGSSLMDFARHTGETTLAEEVRALDRSAYGDGAGQAWEGATLWAAFRDWRRTRASAASGARGEALDLYAPGGVSR